MKAFMLSVVLLLMLCLPQLSSAELVYMCMGKDGSVVFTNKEIKGSVCSVPSLPELSVVPDRKSSAAPIVTIPDIQAHDNGIQDPPLIDSGRQTYAINPVIGHNVASQVCDLYGKWLDLNLSTRGGLYYNNLTAPLMTMFGGGYIPMECRRQ